MASSQLTVRLSELPLFRRVELGVRFVSEAIADLPLVAALGDDDDREKSDASCDLEVYASSDSGDDVFVRGKLTGKLVVACSRCVDPVVVRVSEDLAVSYLPADRVPDDDDTEGMTEDDVDLYPYEGESLDLTTLFRERLIMAVPFAPLCREDCKGLCSVCGADLNSGECGCDRHVGDPRLAALRDLAKS